MGMIFRRYWLKTLLSVGVVIVALAVVEVVLRVINFQETDFLFKDFLKAPPQARFFALDNTKVMKLTDLESNAVTYGKTTQNELWSVDQYGFRPDYRDNAEPAREKILLVGDSFTYGHGVSLFAAYPTILEKNLSAKGYDINVINAGVPGYGPDQMYNQLIELLPQVKPSIVIWNLYQNDLSDANYYCLYDFDTQGNIKSMPIWLNNAYRQGWLVTTLPHQWFELRVLHVLLTGIGYPIGGDGKVPLATIGCTEPITDETRQKLQQKIGIFLERIEKKIAATGGKLIVVAVPYQHAYTMPGHDYNEYHDEHRRNSLLEKIVLEQKIPFCDAKSTFAQFDQTIPVAQQWFQSNEEESGYIKHLNAAGYAKLAEVVEQCLIEQSFLSPMSHAQ